MMVQAQAVLCQKRSNLISYSTIFHHYISLKTNKVGNLTGPFHTNDIGRLFANKEMSSMS